MENKGLRYNTGKRKWSLVDFDTLSGMVEVLEFGSLKYSAHNWRNGLKHTEIAESLMRHLVAFLGGEDNDPESGLPHVDHIQCNAMFLAYMTKFKKELDDRYKDDNKPSKEFTR